MDSIQKYDIFYTQSAITDIEDKADYIAFQLRAPDVAEAWYRQLRETILENLSKNILYTMWNLGTNKASGCLSLVMMWFCIVLMPARTSYTYGLYAQRAGI